MLFTHDEVGYLLTTGFKSWKQHGDVKIAGHPALPLVLFNYVRPKEWNWFEMNSRGTVYDRDTGELVARPFVKFFNYGEGGRTFQRGEHIKEITEKVDGSLVILFYYRGEWMTTTKGSFTSPQAAEALDILLKTCHVSELDPAYTYLLEVVYPENRIVVDYGVTRALYLLGMVNLKTGEDLYFFDDDPDKSVYAWADRVGFLRPSVHSKTLLELIEECGNIHQVGTEAEGFVVRTNKGNRFKLKYDAYLGLHKAQSGFSEKRVLDHLVKGTYFSYLKGLSEEQTDQAEVIAERFNAEYVRQWRWLLDGSAPYRTLDRKRFAGYVKFFTSNAVRAALFKLYDFDYQMAEEIMRGYVRKTYFTESS